MGYMRPEAVNATKGNFRIGAEHIALRLLLRKGGTR